MRRLQTATLSNQTLAAYLLLDTYTADADRAVMVRVVIDQVAGNGDYLIYSTIQQGGAGSAYMVGPITTFTVPSGTTSIGFTSVLLPMESGDVAKVYVKGLAGDTTTPDIITRWYELTYLRPTTAGRTLDVAATGEAGLDFDNIKAATGATTLTNITVPIVSAVTGLTSSDVAAIKAKTDQFVFTVANQVDANAVSGVNVSLAVSATDAITASAGSLAVRAGYTFRQTITSTFAQDLSTATKLWLSIKTSADATDDESLILIEKTAGLTRVNGAAYATIAHGSLTVSGTTGAWSIDIYIDEVATALLYGADISRLITAGVKAKIGNDVVPVWEGDVAVSDGIVRATS